MQSFLSSINLQQNLGTANANLSPPTMGSPTNALCAMTPRSGSRLRGVNTYPSIWSTKLTCCASKLTSLINLLWGASSSLTASLLTWIPCKWSLELCLGCCSAAVLSARWALCANFAYNSSQAPRRASLEMPLLIRARSNSPCKGVISRLLAFLAIVLCIACWYMWAIAPFSW